MRIIRIKKGWWIASIPGYTFFGSSCAEVISKYGQWVCKGDAL